MGWGQEHTVAGPFIPNTVCRWCNNMHSGRCPQVRAIEYHPNGTVKRVEFVADTPLPSPARPIRRVAPGEMVALRDGEVAPTFVLREGAPDIEGRDIRKPLPSVGP